MTLSFTCRRKLISTKGEKTAPKVDKFLDRLHCSLETTPHKLADEWANQDSFCKQTIPKLSNFMINMQAYHYDGISVLADDVVKPE